ncbi:MAG: YdjY domain-containing protein [Verrucomicrobiales bacterium]
MNRIFLSVFFFVFVIVPAQANEPLPPSASIDPGKGSVSESGKFEPKIDADSSAPAPDPAARLAEIGITADQEKVRIGAVELDRKTQTISIPATVNMLEGAVEYFLVHENGKRHESIFATRAKPEDIHIACLLAGWKPAEKPVDIEIRVTWETNGPPRSHGAEELVAIADGDPNALDGRHIDEGPWHYTGSRVDEAGFVATREGSIIALIADPGALVGNPRPGRLNDSLHAPNRAKLPAKDHPVRILLRRMDPGKEPPKE